MKFLKDLSRRQKRTVIRLLISLVLLIAASLIPLDGIWKFLIFLPAYIVIGYDVVKDAVLNIVHGQLLDEKFLMTLATVGAFATGDYKEAVAVMLFYQVGSKHCRRQEPQEHSGTDGHPPRFGTRDTRRRRGNGVPR